MQLRVIYMYCCHHHMFSLPSLTFYDYACTFILRLWRMHEQYVTSFFSQIKLYSYLSKCIGTENFFVNKSESKW